MRSKIEKIIISIGIPILVGSIAGFLVKDSRELFEAMNKPSFAPPGFIFPIVWTILYVLMGVATYLVISSDASQKEIKKALLVYGIQLAFNFGWSFIFFGQEWYLVAFIWLVILWIFIILTIIAFYQISKPAAYLMIPYLLWVTFAGVLNFAIYLLN